MSRYIAPAIASGGDLSTVRPPLSVTPEFTAAIALHNQQAAEICLQLVVAVLEKGRGPFAVDAKVGGILDDKTDTPVAKRA